jgi:hypothetical protein
MRFDSLVLVFCDRFLAQRTFDLIVAPALADLEFEEATGRRSRIAMRAAVLRAIIGAWRHDVVRGSDAFLRLTLLSTCYYMFPVVLSAGIFKTWSGFFIAATAVLALSLVPVMVCFWPARRVRPTE